jgi:hypothetical protein
VDADDRDDLLQAHGFSRLDWLYYNSEKYNNTLKSFGRGPLTQ